MKVIYKIESYLPHESLLPTLRLISKNSLAANENESRGNFRSNFVMG